MCFMCTVFFCLFIFFSVLWFLLVAYIVSVTKCYSKPTANSDVEFLLFPAYLTVLGIVAFTIIVYSYSVLQNAKLYPHPTVASRSGVLQPGHNTHSQRHFHSSNQSQ